MFLRKIVVLISFLVLLIFIVAIFIGIHWGLFKSVHFSIAHFEKMIFISTKQQTYYATVDTQIDSIKEYFKEYFSGKNSVIGTPAILIRGEPLFTSLSRLEVSSGILVKNSFFTADSLFRTINIDSGEVVRASITAYPFIAPYKLYPALDEWLYNNNYKRDTCRAIIQLIQDERKTELIYPVNPSIELTHNQK